MLLYLFRKTTPLNSRSFPPPNVVLLFFLLTALLRGSKRWLKPSLPLNVWRTSSPRLPFPPFLFPGSGSFSNIQAKTLSLTYGKGNHQLIKEAKLTWGGADSAQVSSSLRASSSPVSSLIYQSVFRFTLTLTDVGDLGWFPPLIKYLVDASFPQSFPVRTRNGGWPGQNNYPVSLTYPFFWESIRPL